VGKGDMAKRACSCFALLNTILDNHKRIQLNIE